MAHWSQAVSAASGSPLNETENTMKAILSNKRKHTRGHYVVDITCPDCDGSFTVGFAGWTGLVCQHCLVELERAPYRSASARMLAALQLVVGTGFPTHDEYGGEHWAISRRQREIARSAIRAAGKACGHHE